MREGRVDGGGGGYDSVSSVTFDPEENKMTDEGSQLELTCLYLSALVAHTENTTGFNSWVSVETEQPRWDRQGNGGVGK